MPDRDFLETPELDDFESRIRRGAQVPHQRHVAQPATHPLTIAFWVIGIIAIAVVAYTVYGSRKQQIAETKAPPIALPNELIAHASSINAMAYSPDGAYLLTGSSDHTAILWNMKNRLPEQYLRGPDGQVTSVAYARSGTMVATGSADGVIRLYRVPSGDIVGDFPDQGGYVESMAFSADSKSLFTTYASSVRMYDIQGDRLLRSVELPSGVAHAVGVSKDGLTLAVTSGSELCLYDLPALKLVARLQGHSLDAMTLAFSPDGKRVVTGGDDKRVVLWDVAGRKQITTLRGHSGKVRVVTFDPKGDKFLTGGRDGLVITWSARDGKQLKTDDSRNTIVNAIAVSPDSQWTAVGGVEERVTLLESDKPQTP
jgi:WD40 repeat protein